VKPRFLVTGAAGKSGRTVIAALHEKGAGLRALVRRPEQADALRALGATDVVTGDLLDRECLAQALQGLHGPAEGLSQLGNVAGDGRGGLPATVMLEAGNELRRRFIGLPTEKIDAVLAVERLQEREADFVEISDRDSVSAKYVQDVPVGLSHQVLPDHFARIVISAWSESIHGCSARRAHNCCDALPPISCGLYKTKTPNQLTVGRQLGGTRRIDVLPESRMIP